MDGYEKILKTIRSESKRDTSNPLRIAVMTSKTSCDMGGIELEQDDLYFAEHLLKKSVYDLDFEIAASGGDSHSHEWKDTSKYIQPLKSGDLVLLAKVSEEKFVVLEKIVEV